MECNGFQSAIKMLVLALVGGIGMAYELALFSPIRIREGSKGYRKIFPQPTEPTTFGWRKFGLVL